MLRLGLMLAQRLLEAPLPGEVSRWLRQDVQAGRLAADFVGRWHRNRFVDPMPYRLSAYYWQMRERPRDRWAYALRTVFTPRSLHYGLVRLPGALRWGYYPLKLLWDYLLIPLARQAG
jgi:hypothetical protein